jgi:hypothetical protein
MRESAAIASNSLCRIALFHWYHRVENSPEPNGCMLGGDDGRTLVVSLAPTYDEAKATANHRAATLVTKFKVPHA